MLDNHDYANDGYDNRPEKKQPREVYDAYLTVNAMLDGALFLYNGVEYCDGNRNSMFFNRFHTNGLDCTIDRSKFLEGAARRRHLCALIKLRKIEPALNGGKTNFS